MKEKKNVPWGRSHSYEGGFIVVYSIAEITYMFKGPFHTLSLVTLFKSKVKSWSWVQFVWIPVWFTIGIKAKQMWHSTDGIPFAFQIKLNQSKGEKEKRNWSDNETFRFRSKAVVNLFSYFLKLDKMLLFFLFYWHFSRSISLSASLSSGSGWWMLPFK